MKGKKMLNAYIYSGLRSPFGRHGGSLANVRPDDLAATVMKELVDRSPFEPEQIEDVVLGCTNQAGEDSRNVARNALLLAGFPTTVAGKTVNRLCGSALVAILDSARAVTCGEGDLYLAGGVESMSRGPFVLGKSEHAYSRQALIYDTVLGSRFPNQKIVEQYGDDSMPETAHNVALQCGLTREDVDRFALGSQTKYEKARVAGFYEDELLPISIQTGRKTPPVLMDEDEHPRPETTYEALSKLRPLVKDSLVTAGGSSGVNDGAAMVMVGSLGMGERAGAKPIARILSGAAAGVDPRVMGLGPVYAIPKALERAGLTLADMDVIEINEAFAAQMLGCLQMLGIDFEDSRINPNGGAIAIGHPTGASGARIALTAARQLQRISGRYAVISLCTGMGQGQAVVIERVV